MEDESPQRTSRERPMVSNGEWHLFQSCLDIALSRVESVLRFARDWKSIRFEPDYETRRTRALFHLNWIMDDEDSNRFTFRGLCAFSANEDLRDVEPARNRIRATMSRECLESLAKPVNERLLETVTRSWLASGPMSNRTAMRGRPVKEAEPVEMDVDDDGD